ncbi:RNA polymerase C-22 sterol desaturase [Basidiobolus ranarum]|uniref:RNA polymerase C-22 sterol desaturase n=1 Tax=Basidiobolus ranarum TaxID=34480 RepID=A0ABR2WQX3_9FUNG
MWLLSIIFIVFAGVFVKYRKSRSSEFDRLPSTPDLSAAYLLFTGVDIAKILDQCYLSPMNPGGIAKTYIKGNAGLLVSKVEYFKHVLTNTSSYISYRLLLRSLSEFMFVEMFPKIPILTAPHALVNKLLGNNIVFSNGKDWRLRRDVINQQFRMGWEPDRFSSSVLDFFECVDSMESVPDLYHIMELMTLDTLGKVLFGFHFEALRKPEGEYISTYFKAIKAAFNVLYIAIPILDRFPTPGRTKGHLAVKEFRDLLGTLAIAKSKEIENQLNDPEKIPSDLLTVLVQSWLDKRLTFEEIIDEMVTLIIAGHDTTANTLSCALYLLAEQSEIQTKAREEINSIFEGHTSTVDIPSSDQIKSLHYLEAIIKETLRLYPPTPILLTHAAAENTRIGNIAIPKGTLINLNFYAMHRCEEYWDEPNLFKPDRWLSPEGTVKNLPSWGPFSDGIRTCIGKSFAMAEMKIALSMIVRRYYLTLPETSSGESGLQFEAEMIFKAKNLHLQFTKISD